MSRDDTDTQARVEAALWAELDRQCIAARTDGAGWPLLVAPVDDYRGPDRYVDVARLARAAVEACYTSSTRSGAEEACLAHNQEVAGSNPASGPNPHNIQASVEVEAAR